MSQNGKSISVGNAQISIINIGNISLPLAGHMNISESDLAERIELKGLAEQEILPIQFILVELADTKLLVDAGIYAIDENPEFKISGYEPPPSLVEQLNSLGIQPDEIDHVVITHRHWDHFNGTTKLNGDRHVPVFTNATHYLGAADWERAESQLQDENSLECRTFGVLQREAMLKLVGERLEIVPGIEIISAPGETVGHEIVRVHSNGQTLYGLGDLYHHPVEFIDPEWMVSWANRELTLKSRATLIPNVLAEDAVLVATHIPGVGKLKTTASGNIWEAV